MNWKWCLSILGSSVYKSFVFVMKLLNRYRIIFVILVFGTVFEYFGLGFFDGLLGFFIYIILPVADIRQTEIVIIILGLIGYYIIYKRSFNSSVKKPKHSFLMYLNKKIFSR